MNKVETDSMEFNRRDFLRGSSVATLMTMLGGVDLFAQATPEPESKAQDQVTKVKCAVIGLGAWGREILNTLALIPQADVAAICDTYPAFLKRSSSIAPAAAKTEDYKTILANKEIPCVIISIPTHQHKDLVLEALQAGKHVYCEAPLATTVEDARAIALAAKALPARQVFQPGLQMRADPQRHFLLPFIRSGALGSPVMARAQWHKKQSWRTASANPEKEKELNWRLRKETSIGLAGEIGIHQLDQAGWFMNARPVSAQGFGSILLYNDDRDVPDTIQAVIEFSNGIRLFYDATLANSFDGDYELYYGTNAAVMLRDNKAWMFKEVDSPNLGWEVYAQKEAFYKETGIVLVANATKLEARTKETKQEPFKGTPLSSALSAFLKRAGEVEDFIGVYGADDMAALAEQMKKALLPPAANYLEGYQATITAIKINEAIMSGQKVVFKPEWYELA